MPWPKWLTRRTPDIQDPDVVTLDLREATFPKKRNPVADLIVTNMYGPRMEISAKRNLAQQADEGYQRNIAVYACINLIARSCAGIPWVLMQKGATPTSKPKKVMTFRTAAKAYNRDTPQFKAAVLGTEIENHPLLMLIEKPNPLQSGSEYLEETQSYLEMTGNSFETWVGPDTGPRRGLPTEMWSLRPDRMRILGGLVGSGRDVSAYRYRVGAGVMDFDPAILLHQRFFSPLDDFYGLSPIQVAALTIDGDNAASLWNQRLLQNDARPSAGLVVKNGMDPDTRSALKEELEARMSGPSNARRPIILEGDVDWKILSLSPADLDWVHGKQMNRREIALVFTIPTDLVDPESHSYGSVEQARKALYQEKILPTMDRRRDNLNNTITRAFGDGLSLDYDRDQIEALHEDSVKLYQGMRQADWLSFNEKRAATGYDEYTGNPETDTPADVPVGMLKPSQLPGAPQDTLLPGAPTTATATSEAGAKAQDLSTVQKREMNTLEKKLTAMFKRQQRALAAHLKS